MLGDIDKAMKTMHNYHQVWRQLGFLPEYYNIPKSETHAGREGYPLRPGNTVLSVRLFVCLSFYVSDPGVPSRILQHSQK